MSRAGEVRTWKNIDKIRYYWGIDEVAEYPTVFVDGNSGKPSYVALGIPSGYLELPVALKGRTFEEVCIHNHELICQGHFESTERKLAQNV